jgi:general secretion pathway protein D
MDDPLAGWVEGDKIVATYKMNRWMGVTWALLLALVAAGCMKGKQAYQHAEKAETAGNYDSALKDYQAALKTDPQNARYKLKTYQMRFEASQFHVGQGLKHLEQKENEAALKEFETALEIDPSSMVAKQELEYTRKLMGAAAPAASVSGNTSAPPSASASGPKPAAPAPQEAGGFINKPPSLAPLSREPVTLKMNEDARIVFRTIGKLAGVNVVFDPDFPDKKISIDLVNVTIQQALQVACVEAKAFWKPVTSNIILVLPDNSAKRRQEEEQILKKIYLEHTQTPQELTEIATGVQQMLELRHVQPVARDNAILIRDTPDKILLASRLIQDSDRGRAEVVVQISVLQVRRDRARSLGIQPGGTTTLAFAPPTPLGPAAGAVSLNKLADISSGDFALTIPNAVAAALMSDSNTKIIQNPEVRVSDGESARLRVGDRVPVATGSFQATAGLGPVVNTQFQYIDVGVNIDLSPHVHPDHSVSMKLSVEVSSLNGKVNIGGIDQPVISQRRIEHDIRLQEGEVSILGGLAERHQTKSVTGWPGLSHLPLLHYLFSGEDVSNSENEVLIVVTPRLVRSRELAQERLQALSVGTDSEISLRQEGEVEAPTPASGAVKEPWADTTGSITPAPDGRTEHPPLMRLLPVSASIKPGETTSIQVQMENMEDLFSASLMFRYDPKLLAVEDVQHGDFLSGGTQEVAIIQRIDKDKGQAGIFTTRQPNTAGVSGKGILLGLVVRRLADGPASLELVEAGTRNSRQRILPVKIEQGAVSLP